MARRVVAGVLVVGGSSDLLGFACVNTGNVSVGPSCGRACIYQTNSEATWRRTLRSTNVVAEICVRWARRLQHWGSCELPGNDATGRYGGRIREKMREQSGGGIVSGLYSLRHPEVRVELHCAIGSLPVQHSILLLQHISVHPKLYCTYIDGNWSYQSQKASVIHSNHVYSKCLAQPFPYICRTTCVVSISMTEKSECKTTLFFYYKIKLGMMHLNVECRYHLYCMRCKLPDMPYTVGFLQTHPLITF